MKLKQIKKTVILLGFALISCYALNAQDVSRYTETYKGTRGLKVLVTRYGAYEKNQALVKITGFDHPWSEHIFLCSTNFTGTDMKVVYTTIIDGKDYELMRTAGGAGTIWLKGNWAFDIVYEETINGTMEGRNVLVNDYNNSPSKTNPK